MTELFRWYKDMQPSMAFLKVCRRLLKLSQSVSYSIMTHWQLWLTEKVLKQPQKWCKDLDQVASSLSTSEDSFKTTAKSEAKAAPSLWRCFIAPPLTITYSSIADHHLRGCVRVYTWGRGVCNRETGGTWESTSLYLMWTCAFQLWCQLIYTNCGIGILNYLFFYHFSW